MFRINANVDWYIVSVYQSTRRDISEGPNLYQQYYGNLSNSLFFGGGANLLCIVFTKIISATNVYVREDICVYTLTTGVRVRMRAQVMRM
jgi:hypothetical protein